MSVLTARWSASPYSFAAADDVAAELGVSPTVAAILARRGCATAASARRFLAADVRHDPWLLAGMEPACGLILRHLERGSRIVVHGDYDVDGVCSTALLVEALRALGCDPAWHLPARADGYGLSRATLERLAAQGAGLVLTADCGITAAAEVDAARTLGLDVVVTDHHRVPERLPACPVVHPALAPYPFEGLCATAVAHKLSLALRQRAGLDPAEAEREVDLVALATVCDLVPLRDENRTLVRAGLAALARTERVGVRALMRVCALEAGDVDERAVGFRLGPRLNAAGRLGSAEAALELLMSYDADRAADVARELDSLNHERRDVETRILFAAEQQRAEQEHAPAYVLAGEGWHPGVVGIVASRITERHHRPCFVISLDGERGRGSGRSIPAFDLHAALSECGAELLRFGGHRAAAGLELERGRLAAFRERLVRHAGETLAPEDLEPVREVDAVVPGTALGLELAEELRRLAPFGHGNPEPTLLVPGVRIVGARSMGEDAQHARFTLSGAGTRAEAVAFRTTAGALRGAGDAPCEAALRLELNEWGGRVEPRVVLIAARRSEPGRCAALRGDDGTGFWRALERELDRPLDPGGEIGSGADGGTGSLGRPAPGDGAPATRALRDRRGEGIAGLAGDLLSSGESVLAVCADVPRRLPGLAAVAGLARGSAADGSPPAPELAVASWDELGAEPELALGFVHLLAVDPPPGPAALAGLRPSSRAAGGFAHLAWGAAEVEFSLRVARAALDLRAPLVEVYRRLREPGSASGGALARILTGSGPHPRSGAVSGRLLRVLDELGVVELERADGRLGCRVVAAPRTALERSPAHRAYLRRLEQLERYLEGERRSLPAPAGRAPRPVSEAAAGAASA